MSDQLRIGLIGYGYMGKVHAQAYLNIPFHYNLPKPIRLVAVCDPVAENRTCAVREAGFAHAMSDYAELIARDDVDIIDCCAPTFLHKQVVIDAFRRGKPVYLEKPVGLNVAECRDMLEAARALNGVCQLAFQNRFSSATLRARQLIQEGAIGDLVNFRFTYFGSEYISVDRKLGWQVTREGAGGGALVSLASHCIDLARFLAGDEPAAVFAATQRRTAGTPGQQQPVPEVETMGQVLLQMQGGATGTIEVSQVAAGSNIDLRYEIYGTNGTIRFDQASPDFLDYFRQDEVATPHGGNRGFTRIQTLQKYTDQPYPPWRVGTNWLRYATESQYQFLDSLLRGRSPSPSIADGTRVQEILAACYRSAELGAWVRL